ncbi:class II lanthipeptide, LchA2/BrtA2 family [Clostridium vincentii]|uniref:Lantibiotic lichenicidin A2 n=1 Tax=Clostridium vincentii TaxID=52704 RepID=A0A2T0BHB3_9CLOT|nr:class II lanthipeptide, LchA2/BrtA2 family [Clostridium vincentii]PRR83238.1 Lantibiotic lichenicidin A2 precursor [Clostridium vincentii]
MSDIKKIIDPAGEINEDELKEVTEVKDATGGISPTVTVAISIAVSASFCPTTKCSSKC